MTGVRSRGAGWSIWDLHVHSPSSIVQNYGGDDDATWERYLDALEALPSEVRVIGLNDYWFLDGYRKVRKAQSEGRLQNLDAVFPVLELRLDQFGGTDGNLRRVNLHVIFDPELDPDVIQQQFIDGIRGKFQLDESAKSPSWQGVVTRDSIAELGRQIKASVPEAERSRFGSDLTEGFNNLNVSLDAVTAALESSYLRGKHLIGLGKTEWAAIKWNEQSIGSKRNVLSHAKLLFTAYEDARDWPAQVTKLKNEKVLHKILDCSDAHTWADAKTKDRLGVCSTWINSTPTFAGLVHALDEFEERVFVGLAPPSLARVRESPEQFIESVGIRSNDPARHQAFDYTLPLNSGFVAVVGNKGQGKSALLDCIALAGNSSRGSEFAFLTPTRFLSASNKSAKEYAATVTWMTGATRSVPLTAKHDSGAPVSVEYLPQRYVERVCTADPLSDQSHDFEDELREVLFTHIPEQDRSGEKSFDALAARKTKASREEIARLRAELQRTAEQFADLRSFMAENIPAEVGQRIALKQSEVTTAQASLAVDREALQKLDDSSAEDEGFANIRSQADATATELKRVDEQISEQQAALGVSSRKVGDAEALMRQALDLQGMANELNTSAREIFGEGEEARRSDLISLIVNEEVHLDWLASEASSIEKNRATAKELTERRDDLARHVIVFAETLAAADSSRELARQRVLQGEQRIEALVGNADRSGSLVQLQLLLEASRSAPQRLSDLATALEATSEKIHQALLSELGAVVDLYSPASAFIADSAVVKNAGLEFRAGLEFNVHIQRPGSLLDGRRNADLGSWISEIPQRASAMDWSSLAAELRASLSRLGTERGAESGSARPPESALRSGTSLTEFLVLLYDLTWLEVRFGLTGDGLPLAQLSPGQRGLVLALFYLIVDRRTTPLLLDQPEENLDNATIASLLVPAIREAARRRQTIIVTHNANLAVVGDADQIVHATITDGVFNVTSGCISEIDVARSAVDVLEGTLPAFDSRRHKYEAFPAATLGGSATV